MKPNVALFHHYLCPHVEVVETISGFITFSFRNNLSGTFPLMDKHRWEEWQHEWIFIRFPKLDEALVELLAVPTRLES